MSGTGKREAYYNEIDPFAAAWLRELIKAGHIAPGVVDERSIEDVAPNDLAGFVQCHFFAGIGVWSYALRRAGWPDDRPVWTGSAPCQPFSHSGQRKGFADERHLWPALFRLISQCRPDVIFGEQVASKDGLAWLDLVSSDLENAGYACGAVDLCAAGFGAPHIRQRLYWVAHAAREQHDRIRSGGPQWRPQRTDSGGSVRLADSVPTGRTAWRAEPGDRPAAGSGGSGGMADTHNQRLERRRGTTSEPELVARPGGMAGWLENALGLRSGRRGDGLPQSDSEKSVSQNQTPESVPAGGLEHPGGRGRERREAASPGYVYDGSASQRPESEHGAGLPGSHRFSEHGTGPAHGQWQDADWLLCRDGKWRPVEPGTFPLAHGAPNRVGRLRGYGNAIVAPQAEAFIRVYMAVGEDQLWT